MTQDITLSEAPKSTSIELWANDDDRSVINLVSNPVKNAMLDAMRARPELFTMDDRTLAKTLRSENCTTTPNDNRLRLAFWVEYDRAQETGTCMEVSRIVSGVCTKTVFYERVLKLPHLVAWMLSPPTSYLVVLEETLQFGLDRMRDILEMETSPGGRPNVKLMELQAKITEMMHVRVKGAVAIVNKNMNLNVSTTDKNVAKAVMGNSMESVNKRLKELERRERAAQNLPDPRPAEVEVLSETD